VAGEGSPLLRRTGEIDAPGSGLFGVRRAQPPLLPRRSSRTWNCTVCSRGNSARKPSRSGLFCGFL
jgi:hypothetical protein